MNALILAAGRGRRLWPYTSERPKCLLQIGAQSLLQHQLERLAAVGVGRVTIVAGFGLDAVRQEVADKAPTALRTRVVYNPFYGAAENLISLWSARAEMDDDFLVLNGDNAFHPGLLRRLAADARPPCQLLVERKAAYVDDDMKVAVDGDLLLRIGKGLPLAQTDAASVGIMRFTGDGAVALRRVLEEAVCGDDALNRYYLDCLERLSAGGLQVRCVDTGGLPWVDIDTPEDLDAARRGEAHFDEQAPLPAASKPVLGIA